MSDAKVDLTLEETLTALYKLASVGASRSLNMDLAALENLAGEKLGLEGLIVLAMVGADTDDEREFCRVCMSAV